MAERAGLELGLCLISATNCETLARLLPQAVKPKPLRRNTPEAGVRYMFIGKVVFSSFRSDLLELADSRGMDMIDALAIALATVAMGIPAIITAAALGSKLGFYW
jgi:hypothetical protein